MTHFFDTDVASEYGVNAAILLQNFCYWIEHNEANGKNYYDGMYWTFNSRKAMLTLFPYMGKKAIENAMQKLISCGLLITGNYNDLPFDRTLWYALTDKGKSVSRYGEFHSTKGDIPFTQKGERAITPKGELSFTPNGVLSFTPKGVTNTRYKQDNKPNSKPDSIAGADAPQQPDEPEKPKSERKKYGEFGWVKLSDDEYKRLLKELGPSELERCIRLVDESAQASGNKNKWKDWNLVVRKCNRDGWGLNRYRSGANQARGSGPDYSDTEGSL